MFFSSFKINESFCKNIETEIYGLKKYWYKDLNYVKSLTSGFKPPYLFFEVLNNQLSEHLSKITGESWEASNWWANLYEPGDYSDIHHHEPKDISCIVFIKTSSTNPLFFDFKPGIINVEENDGLVLFFDSSLHHGVKKCEKERITLAVDFTRSI